MKWHYVCEKGVNGDCRLKCETFTAETISHIHGCPKSHFGQSANWMNLGFKESPYDQIPDDCPDITKDNEAELYCPKCKEQRKMAYDGNWKCSECDYQFAGNPPSIVKSRVQSGGQQND